MRLRDSIRFWIERKTLEGDVLKISKGVFMMNFDFPAILELFPEHSSSKRSQSASFLIWYLENYYRLDTQSAIDSVCDFRGDKGVDGIFVSDNEKSITIFQSTIKESALKTIGDKVLREFDGTINQFRNSEAITSLLDSKPSADLRSLISRLDLINKVSTYSLRGEYLCNVSLDSNGEGVLATSPRIEFIGKDYLVSRYISDERDAPVHKEVFFEVGDSVTHYTSDADTELIIAAVSARELIAMDGIANQSLYKYNVRGPLSRSPVNGQIRDTIKDQNVHKEFPLFHNGITVVAGKMEYEGSTLRIADYYVVNGCQSLTTLFDNQKFLTDELHVLVKFIRLDPRSALADKVTRYSNNQNAVKDRDFVANDPSLVRLQNEFNKLYENEFYFEIKRGELPPSSTATVISNEIAGLLLRTFDLKEPEAATKPSEMLDPSRKFHEVFNRPEVTADRIVLLYLIWEEVGKAIPFLENELMAKYNLMKYALVFLVRTTIEKDDVFTSLNTNPEMFVRDPVNRKHFRTCVAHLLGDVIIDVNAEISEQTSDGKESDFNYREKLRQKKWLSDLSSSVVAGFQKQVKRGRVKSFGQEWEARDEELTG